MQWWFSQASLHPCLMHNKIARDGKTWASSVLDRHIVVACSQSDLVCECHLLLSTWIYKRWGIGFNMIHFCQGAKELSVAQPREMHVKAPVPDGWSGNSIDSWSIETQEETSLAWQEWPMLTLSLHPISSPLEQPVGLHLENRFI